MSVSNRVGPVIFSNRKARDHLERHGSVVTFRTSDRTTGETHVRYERTGTKQHDCFIMKLADVAGIELEENLEHYYSQAGFSSADEWKDAIRELHGEVPDEGYLYRVDLPVGEAGNSDTENYHPGGDR